MKELSITIAVWLVRVVVAPVYIPAMYLGYKATGKTGEFKDFVKAWLLP